jgi:hypothetical protein
MLLNRGYRITIAGDEVKGLSYCVNSDTELQFSRRWVLPPIDIGDHSNLKWFADRCHSENKLKNSSHSVGTSYNRASPSERIADIIELGIMR